MLLSILRNIVTVPLGLALKATTIVVTPFAAVLEKAQDSLQGASTLPSDSESDALANILGLLTGKSPEIANLANTVREAIRQQLMSDAQFEPDAFQQNLASEMQALGFDDAMIQRVTLNLNGLFAELRVLPPDQKQYLLEQLGDSRPDVVSPAADAALMQ